MTDIPLPPGMVNAAARVIYEDVAEDLGQWEEWDRNGVVGD